MKRKGILFVFVFLCALMISGCGNRSGYMAAFPFVKINHSIYTLDSAGTVIAELPDGYTENRRNYRKCICCRRCSQWSFFLLQGGGKGLSIIRQYA